MDCSMPGIPVHHQLLELAQTHVHQISDVIQPHISFSVVPFSSCLQYFLASESFSMSQFFASGGQNILEWRSSSIWYCSGDPWHYAVIETYELCQLPMAQWLKNPPAMQETQVWYLGQEYPLEEGMEIHSSILAWRIPWTNEPGRLQSIGSQRVRHNWSDWAHMHRTLQQRMNLKIVISKII